MKEEISVEQREKLYEEVWAEAMSKVAPRYGVSDVWLRKKCVQWGIPLPSREYRGRVAHGQNPKKTPLPPLNRETKKYVYGYAVTYVDIESLPEAALYCEEPLYVYSEMTKQIIEKARKGIDVPTSPRYLNDLLKEKLKELEKDKKVKSIVPYKRIFNTMQAICDYLNDTECIGFAGTETADIRVAGTMWEAKYLISQEKGKISIGLRFTECYCWKDRQKREFTISDTAEQQLEEQTGEIIYRLFVESGKILLEEEQEKRRERRKQAEEARRRKLEPYIKAENEKASKALQDAEAFRHATEIRQYADAFYQKNCDQFMEKTELLGYYHWLLKRADWVDPLIENDYDALLNDDT